MAFLSYFFYSLTGVFSETLKKNAVCNSGAETKTKKFADV